MEDFYQPNTGISPISPTEIGTNIKTAMRIQLKLVSADEFIFFLKSQGKLESKQHFLGIYIVM